MPTSATTTAAATAPANTATTAPGALDPIAPTAAAAAPRATPIRVPALDGYSLAATLHEPAGAARGAVLIASAMGVPRRLYEGFGAFLAARGLAALAFDYRGVGESRPPSGSLRGFEAHLHDWAEQDLAGALRVLEARFPGAPLLYVGHSVGGQLLGLTPGAERVRRALLVAAQSGHWRLWAGLGRARMAAFWYALVPALTLALGYLPMRLLLGGEDVPQGVGREWARWGREREYVRAFARRERGGGGFATLTLPIRALAIEGDPFAPRAAVEALASFYERAQVEVRAVPASVGGEAVGHFGLFRRAFRATLWEEAAAYLEGGCEAESAPRRSS